MLPFIFWIPTGVTLILGVVFLFFGSVGRRFKILGAVAFALAVYLQFFSGFPLVGLLLQVALALSLVLWRRLDATR